MMLSDVDRLLSAHGGKWAYLRHAVIREGERCPVPRGQLLDMVSVWGSRSQVVDVVSHALLEDLQAQGVEVEDASLASERAGYLLKHIGDPEIATLCAALAGDPDEHRGDL